MGTATIGKVLVPARIESLKDQWRVQEGSWRPDQARAIDVAEALVDTGAVSLHLPKNLIDQLGLVQVSTRRMRNTSGVREAGVFQPVLLKVRGRECRVEVIEVPETCHVLIGQVPLELLDFVVDPSKRRLIGNPDHDGELMWDEY